MSLDIYEDIRRKIERIDQEYKKMHQRGSPFRKENSQYHSSNTPANQLRYEKAPPAPLIQLRSATPVGISLSHSRASGLKQSQCSSLLYQPRREPPLESVQSPPKHKAPAPPPSRSRVYTHNAVQPQEKGPEEEFKALLDTATASLALLRNSPFSLESFERLNATLKDLQHGGARISGKMSNMLVSFQNQEIFVSEQDRDRSLRVLCSGGMPR
jgi:hypothetical protein